MSHTILLRHTPLTRSSTSGSRAAEAREPPAIHPRATAPPPEHLYDDLRRGGAPGPGQLAHLVHGGRGHKPGLEGPVHHGPRLRLLTPRGRHAPAAKTIREVAVEIRAAAARAGERQARGDAKVRSGSLPYHSCTGGRKAHAHAFSRVRAAKPSGLRLGTSQRCTLDTRRRAAASSFQLAHSHSASASVRTRPVGSSPCKLPTNLGQAGRGARQPLLSARPRGAGRLPSGREQARSGLLT